MNSIAQWTLRSFRPWKKPSKNIAKYEILEGQQKIIANYGILEEQRISNKENKQGWSLLE